MSSFELPQDIQSTEMNEPVKQQVGSMTYSFDQHMTAKQPEHSLPEISGGNGAPFVLNVEQFKNMTPAESFALAGELVKRTREETVAKENEALIAEEEKISAENKGEAAVIQAEMAAEEAALVEKYGPKESWPEEAKQKSDIHRLGWGLAGVAGLTAIGGFAASEANAMDIGGVVGNRAMQGVQIETGRMIYQEQARTQYENQRMQLEARIEQGRSNMEMNFQRQEAQKNLQWENEWNQQTTEAGRAQVKARQDAEWRNFVTNVQIKRQQFEANANMQRQQLDMYAQARMNQVNSVSSSRQRQADANVFGQVLNQGIYRVFGR